MKDKLNITIRIADQPPISLRDITHDEEAAMREAEYNINRLWSSWCKRFKDKTPSEVLAMVTFQFAQLYYRQTGRMAELEETLRQFEGDLDKIVLRLDGDADDATEVVR